MIAPLAMIDAVWPILLPALLLRGNPPPPPGTLGLVCSTQAELFTQLSSMGSICCGQLNEACLASSSFPLTCVALECERTVRRVAAACGPLLNGSSVYDEWKSQLGAPAFGNFGLQSAASDRPKDLTLTAHHQCIIALPHSCAQSVLCGHTVAP
eukprot:SAG31_NODE_82_length_27046_cov_45.857275_13_plen_154_part_00